MKDTGANLRVSLELELGSIDAFEVLVEELECALARVGMRFETGADGRITEGLDVVGSVVSWQPGERILMQWHPADWDRDDVTEVEIGLEKVGGRTRITLEHRGWGRLVGGARELIGWFSGELAATLLRATAPSALGDWITDRRARRPCGAQSRGFYRDPLYHYPNFRVILAELALTAADYFLEVGCGGGAMLRQALRSGCRAAAVDHSPDMVRLAREVNRDAVAGGRLEVRLASADRLPFPDETFTCAAMTGVLGFLADPVAALQEMRRTLTAGGRIVLLGSDPALKGTPAAPEPMASRLRFYSDEEFKLLADRAGFSDIRLVGRHLESFAREAGVPEEHLPLFKSPTSFLLAKKG